jgi:Zn-dependent protease
VVAWLFVLNPIVLAVYLAVFASVVIHEYGHSLAAKKLDVPVNNIILLPIGGMAHITMPNDDPVKEFYVTIAGPATNLVIAFFCAVVVLILYLCNELVISKFVEFYMWVQLILVCFNFLPIFPMDGGRLFRSSFSLILKDSYLATKIAVRVGQVGAVLTAIFFVLVMHNYIVPFIMLFIIIFAQAESKMAAVKHNLKDYDTENLTMGQQIQLDYALQGRFADLEDVDEVVRKLVEEANIEEN